MVEETAIVNGRISNFEVLMTLTLTLDRVILHTIVHHSSTSTYMPNLIEIKETFCGRTNGQTFKTSFIRLTLSKSRPKNAYFQTGLFSRSHLGPRYWHKTANADGVAFLFQQSAEEERIT